MALRVATFNAGLAIGVLPYTTERAPLVIRALADLDVDLLFVQEFWIDAHWNALCEATHSQLAHAFRPEPLHGDLRGACSREELEPLRSCGEKRCAGLADEALARCVVEHCAATALTLPTPCLNCIASQPVGSLDDILGRCIGEQPAGARMGRDSNRYGGLIAYGGSFGTGLLSREPLLDRDVLIYDSTVNARGALHAIVSAPGFSRLHVFATHLSPGGVEQPGQLDQLLEWVDRKAHGAPALLLGDLNVTPDSALFQQIERAGFRESSPPDRRATYSSAALGTGRIAESGWRLDHVLVRNMDVELVTERILDEPVTLDASGRAVRSTLSDHFGVLCTLERRS